MTKIDVPITRFQLGATLPRVSHRSLREHLGPLVSAMIARRGALTLVNARAASHDEDVVFIAGRAFSDLVDQARTAEYLRSTVGLLLAGARAGVSLPSETLDRLGLNSEENLDALQKFQATHAVVMTHDEDGNLLVDAGIEAGTQTEVSGFVEDEEEIVFLDEEDE